MTRDRDRRHSSSSSRSRSSSRSSSRNHNRSNRSHSSSRSNRHHLDEQDHRREHSMTHNHNNSSNNPSNHRHAVNSNSNNNSNSNSTLTNSHKNNHHRRSNSSSSSSNSLHNHPPTPTPILFHNSQPRTSHSRVSHHVVDLKNHNNNIKHIKSNFNKDHTTNESSEEGEVDESKTQASSSSPLRSSSSSSSSKPNPNPSTTSSSDKKNPSSSNSNKTNTQEQHKPYPLPIQLPFQHPQTAEEENDRKNDDDTTTTTIITATAAAAVAVAVVGAATVDDTGTRAETVIPQSCTLEGGLPSATITTTSARIEISASAMSGITSEAPLTTTTPKLEEAEDHHPKSGSRDGGDSRGVSTTPAPGGGGVKTTISTTTTTTTTTTDSSHASYSYSNSNARPPRKHPHGLKSGGSIYGRPVEVEATARFPAPASTLGPWFCLGQLGKGTFSSIHKVLFLGHKDNHHLNHSGVVRSSRNSQSSHGNSSSRPFVPSPPAGSARTTTTTTANLPPLSLTTTANHAPAQQPPQPKQLQHQPRLAAAKVEWTEFQQSGVLEAEAAILDFLDRSLRSSLIRTQSPALGGGEKKEPTEKEIEELPAAAVPRFYGYYRSTVPSLSSSSSSAVSSSSVVAPTGTSSTTGSPSVIASALVMECLPGRDMHQLREAVMARASNNSNSNSSTTSSRRIDLDDAIYLCADVMLPLLRRIHSVGIIHRDVKPSNCVLRKSLLLPEQVNVVARQNHHYQHHKTERMERKNYYDSRRSNHAITATTRREGGEFCMVDFGLSKSIVTSEDSPHADRHHYWPESQPWQKPMNYKGRGCYRIPREKAEFRGTSMYASLRVHQSSEYCPRDDVWSLMYVFCDLASGGLPWMQQAAGRDRAGCQSIKEAVHGEAVGSDHSKRRQDRTEWLLMGDIYHVAKFRKDRYDAAKSAGGGSSASTKTIELPPPLSLSHDSALVDILRKVFSHLGQLQFWDVPDYDLIQRSIRSFSRTTRRPPSLPRISFDVTINERASSSNLLESRRYLPRGALPVDSEPLNDDVFENVEDMTATATTDNDPFRRLPLELQYRMAKVQYLSSRPESVSKPTALRDWLKVTLPLLYGEWDTPKYEGRHRTSTDGFKRELYLVLLQKCLDWASAFDWFRSHHYFFTPNESETRRLNREEAVATLTSTTGVVAVAPSTVKEDTTSKKRRRTDASASAFLSVSRALFGLRQAIQVEQMKKSSAHVARITFS